MSKRYCVVAAVLIACVVLATAAAAQPRISNGQVTPQSGATLAQTFQSVVAAQAEVAWVGYAVPVRDRTRTSCCWSSADGTTHFSGTMSSGEMPCCGACGLEPSVSGFRTPGTPAAAPPQGPIKLEGSDQLVILFRVVDKQVERVRTFSEDCALDAGGRTVHWLQNVRPADSIALLGSLIDAEAQRKSRVTNAALAAISQHAEPAAIPTIERLARSHATAGVRGEALFWLAQMAGDKVAGTITAAIDNDPDTEVKRRAVFALSQLPKN